MTAVHWEGRNVLIGDLLAGGGDRSTAAFTDFDVGFGLALVDDGLLVARFESGELQQVGVLVLSGGLVRVDHRVKLSLHLHDVLFKLVDGCA